MVTPIQKLPANTGLPGLAGQTLADFWSWAYSDVLSNTNRAAFAEFLVASALGLTMTPRRDWDMVDLRYQGKYIEVKASAYSQSWAPASRETTVRFDIASKLPWDGETNTSGTSPVRSAHVYVFCLYPERDRGQAVTGVLDASAWLFYVLATEALTRRFGNQKSITLRPLHAACAGGPVHYGMLREKIDVCLLECV